MAPRVFKHLNYICIYVLLQLIISLVLYCRESIICLWNSTWDERCRIQWSTWESCRLLMKHYTRYDHHSVFTTVQLIYIMLHFVTRLRQKLIIVNKFIS